jgi:hypothetical protein
MIHKKEKLVLWYDRKKKPVQADRQIVYGYAKWVRLAEWKFFCTFTFAWPVSDRQAEMVFSGFINRLERRLKCDIGYVRGDEKRFSGCGMPASGRHFHALLSCAAPVTPVEIEELWMRMAGNRSDGAGAQVKNYTGHWKAASYVLKSINQPEGNWAFRKLHLFYPSLIEKGMTSRMRRNLRRHKARQEEFERIQEMVDKGVRELEKKWKSTAVEYFGPTWLKNE